MPRRPWWVVVLLVSTSLYAGDAPELCTRKVLRVEAVGRSLYVGADGVLYRTDVTDVPCRDLDGRDVAFFWQGGIHNGYRFVVTVGVDGSRWIRQWNGRDRWVIRRFGPDGKQASQPLAPRFAALSWQNWISATGPHWGRPILCRADRTWFPDFDRMHIWTAGRWSEVPFPQPADKADAYFFSELTRGNSFRDILFADGEAVWMSRSPGHAPRGSHGYLLHVTPTGASIVYSTPPGQYVNGMVKLGADRYFLLEDWYRPGVDPYRWVRKPVSILRVGPAADRKDASDEQVRQWVADLDSDVYRTRKQATESLSALPSSRLGVLRKAMKESASNEARVRLEGILKAVGLSSRPVTEGAELAGFPKARMMYVDRAGRVYAEAWTDGGSAKRLLVADGKSIRELALPEEDMEIDTEDAAGRVYLRGRKALYRLGPTDEAPEPIVRIGALADRIPGLLHVDAKGRLLIAAWMPGPWREGRMYFWVDPAQATDLPPMPGEALAAGLSKSPDNSVKLPACVTGPGETLWFPKPTREKDHVDLYRIAGGGQPERVAEGVRFISTSVIWPLTASEAIVVTPSDPAKYPSAYWIDGHDVQTYPRLKDLVEARSRRLLEVLPAAGGFQGSFNGERPTQLLRVGDGLLMSEQFYDRSGEKSKWSPAAGIYRGGKWVYSANLGEPSDTGEKALFKGVLGIDADKGSVIAFGPEGRRIVSLGVATGSEQRTVLQERDKLWWQMTYVRGDGARFTAPTTAVPELVDRWLELNRKGKYAGVEDYVGFRTWAGSDWRTIPFSMYSTAAYRLNGTLFCYSVRGKAALLPDGTVQELDAEAARKCTWIARADDETVWINDIGSMRRLCAVRDAPGGPVRRWEQTHRYSLAPRGFCVTGPFFAGDFGYYVSDGTLYRFRRP